MICDFAEFYGVLDFNALPLPVAATLAQGLPPESRIMRKLSGTGEADSKTALLAVIADRLGHIAWMLSEDGRRGQNHPGSILELIIGTTSENEAGFDTGEDFMAAWAATTGGD